MRHNSVLIPNSIEFINMTPINPLISKCQIKVCYVDEKPNRNRTIITKEVATQMANSLPGSPIVGFYNEETQDFEEHDRSFEIKDGKIKLIDITKPYGFVDLNAKVWFAKYLDDDTVEREYLVTEGWLWTGQYPECQRILDKGNNQSMELDEKTLSTTRAKNFNEKAQFFIINEAIISKLCILGEDYEPCFEGASVEQSPTIQFSLEDDFKNKLFSMMKELKDLLDKGENRKMFTRYNDIKIGDELSSTILNYIEGKYKLEEVCIEDDVKFAVVSADGKFYRLNYINDENRMDDNPIELEEYTLSDSQFTSEEINNYFSEKNKDKSGEEDKNKNDNNTEEDKCPECGNPVGECTCKDKKKYSLEDIPEYVELQNKYSELETKFSTLSQDKENLESQLSTLVAFKAEVDKKEKQAMIDSFYMLSDEDKKEVNENIDKYSLDEIEAKLSILCVRNKVSFSLDKEDKGDASLTYNLNDVDDQSSSMPDWVKAALRVSEQMN